MFFYWDAFDIERMIEEKMASVDFGGVASPRLLTPSARARLARWICKPARLGLQNCASGVCRPARLGLQTLQRRIMKKNIITIIIVVVIIIVLLL